MMDIPIAEALLLWNAADNDKEPAFAVRPIGHDDYYRYDYQNGACFDSWQKADVTGQKFKLMIELWHITTFYGVPTEMMQEELLCIPEYRDMLAADCLPQKYHEQMN